MHRFDFVANQIEKNTNKNDDQMAPNNIARRTQSDYGPSTGVFSI